MEIPVYYVDAFADRLFSGNPAAVCFLPYWLGDQTLLAIAHENNLPATAFLVKNGENYHIRSFTPNEIPLCGHGTLAAAYVIFNKVHPQLHEVVFQSTSGNLNVKKDGEFIVLNFPQKIGKSIPVHSILKKGFHVEPEAVFQYEKERCILVFHHQRDVESLAPDMSILKKYECPGIVATAPGDKVDFVSRTFYPHKVNHEDQVTGVSHCMLAPYWAKRLGKHILAAHQLSPRGGYVKCEVLDHRVLLSAKAVLYLQGSIILT